MFPESFDGQMRRVALAGLLASDPVALVPTESLLSQPDLPADLAEQIRAGWDGTPDHLSLLQQSAVNSGDIEFSLILIHAEDQLMQAGRGVLRGLR